MARYRFFRRSLGRRSYYSSRGSRRWRNFKRYNYQNLKIDTNFHVQYPETEGSPELFYSNTANNHGAYLALDGMLNQHSDWPTFKPLYQLYRIKGFRIEATPMPGNAGGEGITQSSGVYFGFAMSTWNSISTDGTSSWLQYTDKSFVLNPLQKTTKYFSLYGMQDDWKISGATISAVFATYSSENSTLNAAPVWHIKMTIYIQTKLANK